MVAYADTDRGKKVEELVRAKLNDADLPEGYELESFTAGIFKPYQCEGDTSDVGDQPCSMNVANVVNGKRLCLDHTFGEMQKLKPGEKLEVESTPKGTSTPLKVDMILPLAYWDGIDLSQVKTVEADDDD